MKSWKIIIFIVFLLQSYNLIAGSFDYFSKLDSTSFLLISKRNLVLSVINETGQITKEYNIACAENFGDKKKIGDHKTPEGLFYINQIMKSDYLKHDFGDGKGLISNAYGPWFFRLDVPGFTDIGIHGTHLPESIGSRCTEGCVRMKNDEIVELKNNVWLGMPVLILPDSTDLRYNVADKVYDYGIICQNPTASSNNNIISVLDSACVSYYSCLPSIANISSSIDSILICKNIIFLSDSLFAIDSNLSTHLISSVLRKDSTIACYSFPRDSLVISEALFKPTIPVEGCSNNNRQLWFLIPITALIAIVLITRHKKGGK